MKIQKYWVRVLVGFGLIFILCVGGEYAYYSPAKFSNGLTIWAIFSLMYFVYETAISLLEKYVGDKLSLR